MTFSTTGSSAGAFPPPTPPSAGGKVRAGQRERDYKFEGARNLMPRVGAV